MPASSPDRLFGTVVSNHLSDSKFGGSYGEIQADNGGYYVWSARNVFRNGSFMKIGARCSFTVVGWSYATDISTRDAR